MSDNDSPILSPEEIRNRRRKVVEDTKAIEKVNEDLEAVSHAGMVKVEYESEGRLNQPTHLWFNDYSVEDINAITLSTEEELLDTVVAVLNKIKAPDCNFAIEDLSSENMLDTLIALKFQFVGIEHKHHWLCKCQYNKDSSEQIVNETLIDMESLGYRSLSESDEEMRKVFKERFDNMSEEQWKDYLIGRYKDNPVDLETYTKEEELSKIKIGDTININFDNHTYTFRTYNTTRDLLKAKKYVMEKWNPKIKAVQNRRNPAIPLAELKDQKEKEIENLRKEQAQGILLYNKALMIEKFDGHAIPDSEKLGLYRKLPRHIHNQLESILDYVEYGLYDEREFACELCGEVDKRLLQHEINPIELLPYKDSSRNKNVSSTRVNGKSSGLNIYFGV